ncbi:MAG: hypothetical protein ACFE9I_14405 [Candidatus Hermodarchaeota archaeon]
MQDKIIKKELRFFNEAAEYIDKFDNSEIIIHQNEHLHRNASNLLRDSMLNELNNLKNIIESNPDLKLKKLSDSEKKIFKKFTKFYSTCPICGNFNHYFNLKQLYFDDNKKSLIEELIRLMTLKRSRLLKLNLHLGVPCCNCFKNMTE